MSEGYTPEAYADLRAELERRVHARVGAELDLSEGDLPGQLVSLLGLRLAQASEAVAAIPEARNPDAAVADSLDTVTALVGLERSSGELDPPLRQRREDALAEPSATAWDELYLALLEIEDVFDVATEDFTAFFRRLHIISASAVEVWGDSVGGVLLEHLAAGTRLYPSGELVQVVDTAGVTQSFNVQLNQGDVAAILDITILVADADDFAPSEVLAAALPPLVDEEGQPFALELAGGARVTRFGYPIVRSDVICRLRDAFPALVDVQVLTTALALDMDVPLAEAEAALWDVANFTLTINELP